MTNGGQTLSLHSMRVGGRLVIRAALVIPFGNGILRESKPDDLLEVSSSFVLEQPALFHNVVKKLSRLHDSSKSHLQLMKVPPHRHGDASAFQESQSALS